MGMTSSLVPCSTQRRTPSGNRDLREKNPYLRGQHTDKKKVKNVQKKKIHSLLCITTQLKPMFRPKVSKFDQIVIKIYKYYPIPAETDQYRRGPWWEGDRIARQRADTLNNGRWIWLSKERECLRDDLVHPFLWCCIFWVHLWVSME